MALINQIDQTYVSKIGKKLLWKKKKKDFCIFNNINYRPFVIVIIYLFIKRVFFDGRNISIIDRNSDFLKILSVKGYVVYWEVVYQS